MPTKSAKKNKGGLVASPPKAKVAKVVQPESEESSSESSESEEEVPVKAVAKAKAASIKKTAPPKDSDDDDDSSDDSDVPNGKATNGRVAPADGVKVAKKEESSSEEDSSEDEKPAVKAPAKPATQKKPAPKDESSEESDDSEDEKPVAKKAATPKAAPAKKAAADSDSSEEDDSEDEKPVAKKATPKAVPAKKAAADSDDSSEEDDSEDEKPVAKKATPKAAPAKKAVPAKKAAADSDDDSEEDDSDEDDSEEEEPKAKPVAKKATPVKAAQSDSDESDSDEDESEEEEPPKPPVLTATVSNAKGVTEKQLKKFFKTKGIKVKQIVKANKKSFTVDFQSAGDTMKAVDLSGQEVGGRSVKIEAEAPPAPASPKKAEKKAAKRPAPADDDVEEESDEEEEESEEEEVAGKRKKGGDAGAVTKKQKVDTSATEEVVTLFVGRLNNDTTAEAVKKLFKKNGIKCKDVRKMDKKRFGYVDLANAEDLDKAIALSGQELDGSEITVERAKPKNQSFSEPKGQTQQYGGRQERDTSADDRTLFVKGLADSVDEGKLQAFFSEASEVRLPQKEGYHRGFAYIVFPDKETAATVLSEKQGADLEGNALYLDYTGSKSSFKPRERSFNDSYGSRDGGDRRKSTGERGSSNVLFVKNLSFHLDEEGLKDAFPNATTARIAKFPDTQKPKGFGFVEFNSPDDAASAYDTMQNAEIDGRQVFLDFASPGGGRGRGGGRGGFGDRGGRGGRGGFGGRGGRGGYGDRGGFRGGRGGFRGGRGGGFGGEPQNKRKKFDDSD